MRKVVVFNRYSVNGAYARENGSLDWFIQDPAVDAAAHELMSPDTVLYGRATYQMFEAVWPAVAQNPNAPAPMKKMADELNEMTKVVFSRTLNEVTWVNSELVKDDITSAVSKLKEGAGADIVIFGSGSIVQQLANADLIDEYLLGVTPVVLADAKSMFEGVKEQKLKLLTSRQFDSGNSLLHYAVER